MNNKYTILLSTILVSSFAFCEQIDNDMLLQSVSSKKEKQKEAPPPRTNVVSANTGGVDEKVLEATKSYLDLAKKRGRIQKVITDDRRIKETLKEMDNLVISHYSQKKKMSDIDSIIMSPNIPQVLMLPNSATITSSYAFPNTLKVTHQLNRVDIVPSSGFDKSTVVVTYVEGNNIKTFTLLVTKAKNNKKSFIYPTIVYAYENVLDVQTLLKRFYDLHHHYPRNGSMIRIDGTEYIFYKDRINGYIDFGKGLYRLEIQQFRYQ